MNENHQAVISGKEISDKEDVSIQHVHPHKSLGARLLVILLFCLGLFIIWGIWRAAFPPRPPIQGQMEARTISVSSKVPGRVLEVLVEEGDFVTAGQAVAKMHLPELEAKLSQAKAQERAARARQSLVDEGPRVQEKLAAKAEWERAQAAANLAQKTYRRISALHKDGLVATQRFDEVQTQWIAASQQAKAAKQEYDIAITGSRRQEKSAAGDASSEALAGVEEVEALTADRTLFASLSAQVDKVVLVEGEMAGAGFPIITLVDLDDQWATFNIREKDMPGIAIGVKLSASVPALNKENIVYSIYYISPRANYATWRSTRQNSGYDMKTFEVRARPVKHVEGLRPGMSVLVER